MADIIGSMSPIEAAIQQQQIERQRAIATALQQSSMQAPQGKMVSGHYVGSSPLEYIAKLAQGLVGSQNQKSLDKQQLGIASAQNQFMGDRAAELAKAVTPIAADPGQNLGAGDDRRNMAYMEHTGAPAPDMVVGAKPAYNPTQSDLNTAMIKYLTATGNAAKTPDLVIQDAKQRMLVNALVSNQGNAQMSGATGGAAGSTTAGGIAPTSGLDARTEAQLMAVDPSGKMLMEARLKNMSPTDEIKNNVWMGRTPQEIALAKRAADAKAGIIELQPGTTALNLATGAERFQPKVGEGINVINGQASVVPGYSDANAQIAGKNAGAVESAKAGYDLTTINPKNGDPYTTTRANVVARANGGAFPSITPDEQAQRDQQAIGIARQEVAQAATPQDKAQAQQVLNTMLARQAAGQSVMTGTATAPSGGIQIQSDADKAAQLERAKLGVGREFDKPKEQFGLTSALSTIDNAIKQIGYLEKTPGLENITGAIAGRTPNISNKAINAQANLDTLKGQIGVHVLNAMREASKTGGAVGSVTEKEWPILQNQLGAIQQVQTTDQFRTGMKDVKDTLERIKAAYSDEFKSKYGGSQGSQPDSKITAPHKITGDADYNALPSGATFVGPDGVTRRKP